MGLLEHIEEVRQKPVAERKRWAFLVAFSVTFVIAVIWISVAMYNYSAEGPEEVPLSAAATTSPFQTIADTVGGAWGSVRKAIDAFGTVDYMPPSDGASSSESGVR